MLSSCGAFFVSTVLARCHPYILHLLFMTAGVRATAFCAAFVVSGRYGTRRELQRKLRRKLRRV